MALSCLRSARARPLRLPLGLSRRYLGDGVCGAPIEDLNAQVKLAKDFFTKSAMSYGEYKAQCKAVRLFAFAGVTGGCVLSLLIDPPKSSYWLRWGPSYWPSHIGSMFRSGQGPLFLTEKSGHVQILPNLHRDMMSGGGAAAKADELNNEAFVFVKPHAVTEKTNSMVEKRLKEKGLKITGEGTLTSEVIDQKKLIDQHYYAIASKATILKPHQLNVPKDKFKAQFGKDWDDALKNEECCNALDACTEFGCTSDELAKAWGEAQKNKKLVKFGGGFYCGEVTMNEKTKYVFNAFFMSMRGEFTKPGRSIRWFTVEWDEKKLVWEDFRGKVLGPTNPKDAPAGSLRGEILKDWKKLGLKSEPNVGDNGMHASASPFEAMSERMNWLNKRCDEDSFCKAMVASGFSEKRIADWSVDPQVKIDENGKKGSLFDAVEDMDTTACLEKLKALHNLQ